MVLESTDYASHFGIENIPFGIASTTGSTAKCATRYRNRVIFLDSIEKSLGDIAVSVQVLQDSTLNALASLGSEVSGQIRSTIQQLIESGAIDETSGHDIADVEMHLPFSIGDFIDFSCSPFHARRAASGLLRGSPTSPPAAQWLPIGYTGCCSSISISGADVVRPRGQFFTHGLDGLRGKRTGITFGPSTELDFELELAVFVGKPIPLNSMVDAASASEHTFGYVLMNDWSARDFQRLEMMPLGPMNSKHSITTISPWVITTHALAAFREPHHSSSERLAPYLSNRSLSMPKVHVQVDIRSHADKAFETFGSTSSSVSSWTFEQLVAHQSSSGRGLRSGDLFSAGTISGPGSDEFGCLMELFAEGEKQTRGYLEDGEEVRMSAVCGPGVGFGECIGKVVPSADASIWLSQGDSNM